MEHKKETRGGQRGTDWNGGVGWIHAVKDTERGMEGRLLFSNYVAFLCVSNRYQANSTCWSPPPKKEACTHFLCSLFKQVGGSYRTLQWTDGNKSPYKRDILCLPLPWQQPSATSFCYDEGKAPSSSRSTVVRPLLDVFMAAARCFYGCQTCFRLICATFMSSKKKKNIKKCFKISTMLIIIQENLILSLKVRDKSLNYLVQTIFDWVLFFVPLEITESHLRHNFQLQKLIKTVGAGQTAAVTRCALHLTTPISRQHLYDILSSCLLIHIHISLNLSSII